MLRFAYQDEPLELMDVQFLCTDRAVELQTNRLFGGTIS